MENNNNKFHSEAYFGEQRNFWWNEDFIQLMAIRWNLGSVKKLLDVGCGLGHWNRVLAPHMSEDGIIYGIDQEPEWVKKANQFVSSRKTNYQLANAYSLPFDENSYDMVTCQTLLIHLKNPILALKEFMRVLKPGGLLAVAEPNNSAQLLIRSNLDVEVALDDRMEALKFQLICDQGKINLGEGDSSVGDLIPGYFSALSLREIEVYLSDKASALFPKYTTLEQRVLIDDFLSRPDFHTMSRDETLKYYLAGGGDVESFDRMWMKLGYEKNKITTAINKNVYDCAGGHVFYLISGRKESHRH